MLKEGAASNCHGNAVIARWYKQYEGEPSWTMTAAIAGEKGTCRVGLRFLNLHLAVEIGIVADA
jgi:hypothetical protein